MSAPQRSQTKIAPQTDRRRRHSPYASGQWEAPSPQALQQTLADPQTATPATLLSLQRSHGNQAVQGLVQRQMVEEEELLQMKPAGPAPEGVIQRQSPEEEELLQMKAAGPAPDGLIQRQSPEEEELLQMKPDDGAHALRPEIAEAIERQRGGGQSLDAAVQSQMEAQLGADFSQVHIHADARAAALSRDLNAKAFTIGQDVFFREGAYAPQSVEGQKLLAHELTHVVQQTAGNAPAAPQGKLTLGPTDDQYEQEADRVAQSVSAQPSAAIQPGRVQRAAVVQRFKIADLLKRKTSAPTNSAPSNPAPSNPAPATPAPTNPPPANPPPVNPPPAPLTPDQAFQKFGSASAATQKAEAIGGHWGFGLATGLAGGASGLKAMGSGIAGLYGNEEGDLNKANEVSAGFGIAGGAMGLLGGAASTVGSSMELAGKASTLRRGLALRSQGGLAGKQLGQQMRRRGGIGVAQKSLGVLSGLSAMGGGISGIGAGARTLQSGKADDSGAANFTTAGNAFGVASGGLTMLSEGLNLGTGIASLRSASRRSQAATAMATQLGAAGANQDTEMADIATFVSQNQNKSGKKLGLAASASNWIGGALGTAGSAAGLGKANLASTVLGGLSTGFGLLGTALSAHAGRKNAAKAEANKAAAESKADQLATKLQAGNANAIKFARDVLGLAGTDDELKQMAATDTAALKELLVQKMMKY